MNSIENEIENLKAASNNTKLNLSELRKKGFDTKIAELKIMSIPNKIKLAEITKNQKDIDKVNIMLNSVNEELNEIKTQDTKGFDQYIKKEIGKYESVLEKKEKQEEGIEITKRTENLINEANDCLNNKNYIKALHNYTEIVDIYQYLPKNLKKQVYTKVIDIYNKVIKSGAAKIIEKEEKTIKKGEKEEKINIFRRYLKRISGLRKSS